VLSRVCPKLKVAIDQTKDQNQPFIVTSPMNKVVSLSYKKDTSTMTDQEKSDRCDELLHEFSQQYYLDAVGDSKTPAAKRARGLRALSAIEQSTCSPEPSERTLTQLKRAFNTTALHHNIDLTLDDGHLTNMFWDQWKLLIRRSMRYLKSAEMF